MTHTSRRGTVLFVLALLTQSACGTTPLEVHLEIDAPENATQQFSLDVIEGSKTSTVGLPDAKGSRGSFWKMREDSKRLTIVATVPVGFQLTDIDCHTIREGLTIGFAFVGAEPGTRNFEVGDTEVSIKLEATAGDYDGEKAKCTFRFEPDPAAAAPLTSTEAASTDEPSTAAEVNLEPTPSASEDPGATATATPDPTLSPTATSGPAPSPSPSPSTSASPQPSTTPTPAATGAPTPTPKPSPTPTPTPKPSPTPTPTPKPSPTPTPTPKPSPTPTGLVCNTNPTGARPTIVSLFAYDGTNNAETNKLVVVFSEPVEIAKVRGVKVTTASGDVRTSTGAVRFNEDWGQDEGEYWTFTMNGAMDNGFNYEGAHSVQVDTACNKAGDGNASSQAG